MGASARQLWRSGGGAETQVVEGSGESGEKRINRTDTLTRLFFCSIWLSDRRRIHAFLIKLTQTYWSPAI